MKKIYLLFLVLTLYIGATRAQTYTQSIDSLMANLDKGPISTGVLYDRVFPFAGLTIFNQFGYSDTSSVVHFREAYSELFSATYNNSGLLLPDSLKGRIRNKVIASVVPIGLINYHFNYIDTLAIQNHLLDTIGGKTFYDVSGRSQSPYNDAYTTVAAALVDSLNFSSVNFQYSSPFFLSNTGWTLSSFTADFGDGSGAQTLTPGQTININYSTTGIKIITFNVAYTNGQSITTYSAMKITHLSPGGGQNFSSPTCNTGFYNPTPPQEITADRAYQGYGDSFQIPGEAVVTTYYHSTDCNAVLKKPIIILNGFDPESATTAQDLIDQHLHYGPNGYYNFAEEMLAKGYDLIFMTYKQYDYNGVHIDGGADYIQRNAYTLVKLIQNVNAQLSSSGSTEKLVVVGPSMGGLISRYALAFMEQQGLNHNTRLWVSFDSPQLGANIPIGDQWLLKYLSDLGSIGSDAKTALDGSAGSVAAREMLLHFYGTNGIAPTADPYRAPFVQELNNLGYPNNLRKIAVINGSIAGNINNQFAQNSINISAQPTLITRFIAGIGLRYLFPIGFLGKVLGFSIFGGLQLDALQESAWFTPGYNGFNKVFEGKLFGVIKHNINYAGTPTNSIGLDNSPGGTYTTQEIIAKKFTTGMYNAGSGYVALFYQPHTSYVQTHSFIPTKSSLAITGGTDFGENFSTRDLVTTGETPFDSYFAPVENQPHVSLTECSVAWLKNEIDGTAQLPVGIAYTLTSQANGCINVPFVVNNVPQGATVTWTVTGAYLLLSSSGNTCTIQRTGPGGGSLTATVSTQCQNSVTVNFPDTQPLVIYGMPSDACGGSRHNSYVINAGYTGFNWTVSGATITSGQGTNEINYTLNDYDYNNSANNNFYLSCQVEDNCGNWDPYPVTNYGIIDDCTGGDTNFAAYPNPAGNTITITSRAKDPNLTTPPQFTPYSYKVFDKLGRLVKSGQSATGHDVAVNTNDLPANIYFLNIFVKDKIYKKQIIVAH